MALIIKSHLLVLLFLPALINFTFTQAAWFKVTNSCPYTVWAAAIPVGGGRQLNPGERWSFGIASGTGDARIWGRTNCNFDWSGRGHCETGDCGGQLNCQLSGQPPATLAEFSLNTWNNMDFYDISVIDGFNVPMEFSPTSNCPRLRCYGDQCPDAYLDPEDNTKTHGCQSGTNYRVVFCP
ncbi:thaumatin-like protein [Neltuma alba]|uniref:thaumatin-like protein n=1 Tax=Neltuma alba TaxID=207710 RepID=UPI0010A55321|nr:thaumatin-like protein [Prosopis alba]